MNNEKRGCVLCFVFWLKYIIFKYCVFVLLCPCLENCGFLIVSLSYSIIIYTLHSSQTKIYTRSDP